ncbi:UNVERIFIED_CONTAM: Sodium/hydrogen exchanger 2 [Sesamum calycinum]|uniref:Sodium/hydrogen exchanger 2 n=1 Tax=Sesamum calycinum TaxID=2727403 RepID=A0AAW2KSY0_9LAMI
MGFDSGTIIDPVKLATSDHASVVSITLFVTLLCACIVIGHLLEENRWMNESIIALIIGLGTGVFILLVPGEKETILSQFHYYNDVWSTWYIDIVHHHIIGYGLLPCLSHLIYEYPLRASAIAFFGKMDIDLAIGDFLAIGAIFAATDSVCTLQVLSQDETPLLYSLVFGEGVVNDATSVVLFNAVQDFDLSHINTGIALQLIGNFFYLFYSMRLGCLVAYVIKKLYFGRHSH